MFRFAHTEIAPHETVDPRVPSYLRLNKRCSRALPVARSTCYLSWDGMEDDTRRVSDELRVSKKTVSTRRVFTILVVFGSNPPSPCVTGRHTSNLAAFISRPCYRVSLAFPSHAFFVQHKHIRTLELLRQLIDENNALRKRLNVREPLQRFWNVPSARFVYR